ncbi:MAG: FkbM family methyltransferase [Alphaproteobacteria bacterium]
MLDNAKSYQRQVDKAPKRDGACEASERMLLRLIVKLFNPLLAKNPLIPSALVKKVFTKVYLGAIQGRGGAQPIIVETFAGRMELSPYDITSCFPLLTRIWEPALAFFVAANLRPGDRFLDIGANIGFYTLLAHKLGAHPMAFEPSPRVLPLLYRNLELNGIGRNVVEALAHSDKSGTARLYDGTHGNLGRSSLDPDPDQTGNASHLVPTAPVDAYADAFKAARMVKIDVEGHEAHLLKYVLSGRVTLRDDFILLAEIDFEKNSDLLNFLKEKMSSGLQIFQVENDYTVRFYRKTRYPVTRLTTQILENLKAQRVDVILTFAPVQFPTRHFDLR